MNDEEKHRKKLESDRKYKSKLREKNLIPIQIWLYKEDQKTIDYIKSYDQRKGK